MLLVTGFLRFVNVADLYPVVGHEKEIMRLMSADQNGGLSNSIWPVVPSAATRAFVPPFVVL